MDKKYLETLSIISLFKGIENIESVLKCLSPSLRKYKKDEYVAISENAFEGMGIIISGRVEIIKENAAGNKVIISILDKGELFGEMIAFSKNKKWPASVRCVTDSVILLLSPDKIVSCCTNVCDSHKALISNMLTIVSEKALSLNKKLSYLSIKNMRSKISTYLLEEYKKNKSNTFLLSINRNDMADFLNVSRPSMSREMGRMRDEGIIDFHRCSIKILDIESLKNAIV